MDADEDAAAKTAGAVFRALFAEELGLVLEVMEDNVGRVMSVYKDAGVPVVTLGKGATHTTANIRVGGKLVVSQDVRILRDVWEQTSFELEKLQANPATVEEEQLTLRD